MLSSFWPLFAANLVMTTVMAIVVALAGWWSPVRRHPRLRHTLWLLVVAKLLTPPVVQYPVLPAGFFEAGLEFDNHGPLAVQTLAWGRTDATHSNSDLDEGARSHNGTRREFSRSAELQRAASHSAVPVDPASPGITFSLSLLAIVALPAAILLARCLGQSWRIGRLVAHAAVADGHLAQIVSEACHRMGLATPPDIRLVAGRLMPLLWVRWGRPTIVLPVLLVDRLRDDQLECIICHELAHFIRRDHWWNIFALTVTAGYWWFPVVWWARRELLAVQEECCDELVVRAAGIPRRRYAETLLQTIDFINDERLLLPALASGFGRVSAVRRRFEMIASPRITTRVPLFAAAFALVIVGSFVSLPVRGQGTSEATDEQRPAANADNAAPQPEPPVKAKSPPVPVVEKEELKYRTADVTVDARKHCLSIGQQAAGQGALRVDLERGVTYKVTATGEAFMSAQTGADADPFPGVVFYYSADEEDGYAVRYVVLKPGESVTFRTPWLISPNDEVFALAFFLDAWPGSENHGSYTLTFHRGDGAAQGLPGDGVQDIHGWKKRLFRLSIISDREYSGLKRALEIRSTKSTTAESPRE